MTTDSLQTTELRSSFIAVSHAVETAVKTAVTEFLSDTDRFQDVASGLIEYYCTSAIENIDLTEVNWGDYLDSDAIKDDVVDTLRHDIDLTDLACELDHESIAECLDVDDIAQRIDLSHSIIDEVDKRVDADVSDIKYRLDKSEEFGRELAASMTALEETVMDKLEHQLKFQLALDNQLHELADLVQELQAKLGRRSWLRRQWDKLSGKVKHWLDLRKIVKQWRRKGD